MTWNGHRLQIYQYFIFALFSQCSTTIIKGSETWKFITCYYEFIRRT